MAFNSNDFGAWEERKEQMNLENLRESKQSFFLPRLDKCKEYGKRGAAARARLY